MSILLEYISPTGTVWNLRTGPVRMAPGATGLGFLKMLAFTAPRGPRGGQRVTGFSAQPNEVRLPMKYGYPGWSALSWDSIDGSWWPAVRPHIVGGVLRVTYSDGTRRSVAVRTTDDGRDWDQDPSDLRMTDFDWSLIADDPWWLGDLVSVPFGLTDAGSPFYGATGYGPPFYISPGNSNGTKQIVNPGDFDAWPVWRILGPISSFTITHADGSTISGTPNLAAGEQLVIDTTEDAKSATRISAAGVSSDYTPSLSTWGWRPIPAGTTTSIQVALTGSGSATAEFRPRFLAPYH